MDSATASPGNTLQFGSISEIFGGSVLVEQVFSYPGLGQAAVTAWGWEAIPASAGNYTHQCPCLYLQEMQRRMGVPAGRSET